MSSFANLTDEQISAMIQSKDATAYQIETWTNELQRRSLTRIAEETRRLSDSSIKLEKLTRTLKVLTVMLIVFAFVQIVVLRYRLGRCFIPKFSTRVG